MKLRMGKSEDESAEQPTGEQASSNDEENPDKTESEVNGEETPKSATESTPKDEGEKSGNTKADVNSIRKVIKLGSSEETEKSETSDEKIEEAPKENAAPSPTTDGATGQDSAIHQSIKDFDFQIKKNQDGVTNLNEKLDAVTRDLDDLVSLYEIVSEQMNPFVGLSKVTKKRIDALENFTREVETLKTRMGDLESFAERAGVNLEGNREQTSKSVNDEYSKNVPEKLIEGDIDLDSIVEESLNALTADEKVDLIIDEFIESLN